VRTGLRRQLRSGGKLVENRVWLVSLPKLNAGPDLTGSRSRGGWDWGAVRAAARELAIPATTTLRGWSARRGRTNSNFRSSGAEWSGKEKGAGPEDRRSGVRRTYKLRTGHQILRPLSGPFMKLPGPMLPFSCPNYFFSCKKVCSAALAAARMRNSLFS
jgi:hypothetical protein